MSPAVTPSAAAPATRRRLLALVLIAALAAGLVPLLQRSAVASESFAMTLAISTSGNRAVRFNQGVDVTGTIPSGSIQSARLVGLEADGDEVAENVDGVYLNKPSGSGDYLQNSGGNLTGHLTLGCVFNEPSSSCLVEHEDVRQVLLEVTVAGSSGRSNALRVDYTRPLFRGYSLVAPDLIEVRFTEPVHLTAELPADWIITNPARTVTEVQGARENDCVGHYTPDEDPTAGNTGCTRLIKVSEPLTEDAQPTAEFSFADGRVPDRKPYHDYATNRVFYEDTAMGVAVDRIRPAMPNIESIDGKAPGSGAHVLSRNPNPVARLTGLTAGHTVEVTVDGDHSEPQVLAPVTVAAGANAVDVTLPTLVHDVYVITAVAIDTHSNRSDNASLVGPRADGVSRVTYDLDLEGPRALAATLVNRRTALVTFTESVFPVDNAGTWMVGDTPVTAQGTGFTRRLVSQIDLLDGAVVTWTPTSDTPKSTGRYGDQAGNGMDAISGLQLDVLPAVPAPTVTAPKFVTYISSNTLEISGTGPVAPNLVAELFTEGADTPLKQVAVTNGAWAFNESRTTDGRYEFQVRLRNTQTGVASPLVTVADIVRDTKAPVVDVTAPAMKLGGREELAVGDPVTIKWKATDAATGDSQRPDHGAIATVLRVDGRTLLNPGTAVAVGTNIPHQPGVEQSFTYTLTEADLAGQGERELIFDVVVTDLAQNKGDDASAAVLLLADRLGFTPVLTNVTNVNNGDEYGVIEVRFSELVDGTTTSIDWLIDGSPAPQAPQKEDTGNGTTVVRLVLPTTLDPNAAPTVEYRAPAGSPLLALRARDDDAWVTEGARNTIDAVIPALTVQAPALPAVVDANSVTFTGTTDQTSDANTVVAFAADAANNRIGKALATGRAGTNGDWTLDVPLTPNKLNRIVVQAVDPTGNRSHTRPLQAFTVTEDSITPVVALTRPRSASILGPETTIRWNTVEANKSAVHLSYRPKGGDWETIADGAADDGEHLWTLPENLSGQIFSLRVRSYDVTGRMGEHVVNGLRADFDGPVLRSARTLSATRVSLVFNERVDIGTSGFSVDGIRATSVKRHGSRQTLVLRRPMDRTMPVVKYSGTRARDLAGNQMVATKLTADRDFVFPVERLVADRKSASKAKLTWRDVRNRPGHIKGYRIIRDGRRIATLGWSARSFVDAGARGSHRYVVRVVDTDGRISAVRDDRIR